MTHTMTGAGWDRTRIEEITDAFHLAEPLEDDCGRCWQTGTGWPVTSSTSRAT